MGCVYGVTTGCHTSCYNMHQVYTALQSVMIQLASLDAVIGWLPLAAARNQPLACGRVYIT